MSAGGRQDGHDAVVSQCRDEDGKGEDILPTSNEEPTSNGDVTLSSMGEVKISLSCSSVIGNWIFIYLVMIKLYK